MEFPDSILVRISHPREHGLLGAFVKVLSFLNFSQWVLKDLHILVKEFMFCVVHLRK